MTIQVGHSLGCPTFFLCVPPLGGRKSTSQQVNGSTSLQVGESMGRCPIGRISLIRPMPFSPFCTKNLRHLWHISIIISVRYNLTDRKNRPFGLFLWGLGWVIIKNGVGVAYFKKLSYFCDSFFTWFKIVWIVDEQLIGGITFV